MQPRHTHSKKWTQFPDSYLSQIEQVFLQAFRKQLGKNKLIIEGKIFAEEILLRVGFVENGHLTQNNFEVSIDYSSEEKNAVDCIHKCIDAAASMMNEFFVSQGEVDFPRQWKNYDFNGKEIWVQYSTENSNLEAEADKLLGLQMDDNLVKNADAEESEDALEIAENINLQQPQIFSGKKKKKEDLH